MRQIGAWTPEAVDAVVAGARKDRDVGKQLDSALVTLAAKMRCEVRDLHLDHDPALVNREKMIEIVGCRSWKPTRRCVIVPKGAKVLRYFPDANDPAHLFWRVGGKTGSEHDVKTRVRGEHGQHSDLALARKNKRIEARLSGKKPAGPKIRSRGFAKVRRPMRRKP